MSFEAEKGNKCEGEAVLVRIAQLRAMHGEKKSRTAKSTDDLM